MATSQAPRRTLLYGSSESDGRSAYDRDCKEVEAMEAWKLPDPCEQRSSQKTAQKTIILTHRSRNSSIVAGLFLLVTLFCVFTPCVVGNQVVQVDNDDIQSILGVLDGSEKPSAVDQGSQAKQPVSLLWGIPDTSATVGKLFSLPIPKDAFKGDIATYKVTEAGKGKLPDWLEWSQVTQNLEGVPGLGELGKEFRLEVQAFGHLLDQTAASVAKDLFSIHVSEDDLHSTTRATPLKEAEHADMKPIKCAHGSPVTMVTVIVDADMAAIQPKEKVNLLKGMQSHLKMPKELLKLLPAGNKPMFDSSALVAGPGDIKKPQHSGALVQWEVGCGNVNTNHMPILQRVESSSQDGSMGRAVGHGIIGWHVTNNRPHAPRRMKRQVNIQATPTLVPTLGPPTKMPVPTMIIEGTDPDSPELPVTRVVPTMASPSFGGEIQPTRSKHHHHHHHQRSKTKGRHHHHHHHKTKHPHMKHSPHHKHHHKTKLPKTPMPTPTVVPWQPTRVVDVTPTMLIDSSLGRVTPHIPAPSPGISRIEVLMPSIRATMPPKTGEPTEILPSRTFVMPEGVTTAPIKPSKTEAVTPATKQPPIFTPSTGKSTTPTEEPFNYAPILRNDIGRITVEVGEILQYKIPKDTFYDFEDGNTENLKLVFLTVDGYSMPHNSWIKFDQIKQTLYGLPMDIHVGRQEYLMAAIDHRGKIARDAFEIQVVQRSHEKRINHEFSVTLDTEYIPFLANVNARIDVANRIAGLYGDKDARFMTITKIAPGSVVYAWANNSVPLEPCPLTKIAVLLQYLITTNDTLNQALVDALKPYRIVRAAAEPRGACLKDGHFITVTSSPTAHTPGQIEPVPGAKSEEDILLTTVIPAGVIAAMLLLAAIVACILYRMKRKGKLSDEDQHTFVNKGIPIIFADELDDKPDPPTKPLIMEDEKPPLPPPEYPRSSSCSAPSTPQSDHKEPFDMTDDDREDTEMLSPPYQPPPPFSGPRESRQARPRMQQAYRNPPPYVPP